MTNRSQLTELRASHALAARQAGFTLKQIADQNGCSRERARQLCEIGSELQSDNIWYELPSAVRNAFTRDGCQPDIAAITTNYTLAIVERIPAMGKKRIEELQAWLMKHGRKPLT